MADKDYLAAAGEDAVSSELLRRGYNVAAPRVDLGVDLFVYDPKRRMFHRVQVKTSDPQKERAAGNLGLYSLPRIQLRDAQAIELHYVFVFAWPNNFEFVVVPRKDLERMRENYEKVSGKESDAERISLRLSFEANDVSGWGQSFAAYRGAFAKYFPP